MKKEAQKIKLSFVYKNGAGLVLDIAKMSVIPASDSGMLFHINKRPDNSFICLCTKDFIEDFNRLNGIEVLQDLSDELPLVSIKAINETDADSNYFHVRNLTCITQMSQSKGPKPILHIDQIIPYDLLVIYSEPMLYDFLAIEKIVIERG